MQNQQRIKLLIFARTRNGYALSHISISQTRTLPKTEHVHRPPPIKIVNKQFNRTIFVSSSHEKIAFFHMIGCGRASRVGECSLARHFTHLIKSISCSIACVNIFSDILDKHTTHPSRSSWYNDKMVIIDSIRNDGARFDTSITST